MEPDFAGYVTKADLKCADGRTIMKGAFAHQDGLKVPLVYQHNHNDNNQVMGHVILTKKDDGVWGEGYFNKTATGLNGKELVRHGDIDKMSVWAKNLDERGDDVYNGDIQEVSLVLAGSNPGATIQNVLMHSGIDETMDLLVLMDLNEIKHADTDEEDSKKAEKPEADDKSDKSTDKADDSTEENSGTTVGAALESLTDEQTAAVNAVIEDAVTEAVTEALTEAELEHDNLSSQKGSPKMARNVFDRNKQAAEADRTSSEMKHSDMQNLLIHAKGSTPSEGIRAFNDSRATGSLKQLVRSQQGKELMHAADYGVENIEILFPDAQALMRTPTFVDRRQDWVKKFMAGTHKSPFSRVKTMHADITAEEARARGYIKGNQKVEEVFPVFKRTTGPTMVYKKQKLDRQDIIDIVDFDVVAWLKVEMRGKLDEELARAGLFGDGRPTMIGSDLNPDKVAEPTGTSGDGIRSIVNDNDLYTGTFYVPLPASPGFADYNKAIDAVAEAREFYMGSGNLTAFMSYRWASKLLTIRDSFGHRIYKNLSELAGDLDVNEIVRVPTELFDSTLLMILIDLSDYNFGANKGGEVNLFDDFDIDLNQYKYLIETYVSGAQTMPYCSQLFRSTTSTNVLVAPNTPARAGNVITIPTQTGVTYKRLDTGATVAAASTITLNDTTLTEVEIEASPAAGYYFADNLDGHDSWLFEYEV